MRVACLFLLFIPLHLFAQISWNVDSISNWRDQTLPSQVDHRKYNEVWGFVQNGREYGVIGSRAGTYIIDLFNPKAPRLASFIAGAYDDATNRDYHSYNGYLYMVCDQGPSTLQIADLSFLPDSAPIIYDSDALFSNCHNIFIDEYTGHLYACDVRKNDTVDLDLEIYDISSSPTPQLLSTFNEESIDAFHDIYVVRDTAWGNNGRSGLFIYDFTDMSQPVILSSVTEYPQQGYNHAGWATADKRYYYFSDETKNTDLKAVDCSDLSDPEVVFLFNSGVNDVGVVAHNLILKDSLLYVSYYHEGLQVFSIRDPLKPVKVGHYLSYNLFHQPDPDLPPQKDFNGYRGAWGVYPFLPSQHILLSDREKGLFVLKMDFTPDPLTEFKGLHPNPFKTELYLNYPSEDLIRLDLYDVNGKVIQRELQFTAVEDFSLINVRGDLQRGIYVLLVEAKSEKFSIKVCRQ
ncbi:MAG: choice-of-anchor B family protein [Vicingaceae bacterium]